MAAKKKGMDASRFEGDGISFKGKLIGVEEVAEARGDLLCQETISKLKNSVRVSGQHKQKVFVNVTLEGLKIIDQISLHVLHTHAVHRISFISRDTTDNRAFGYIIGSPDGKHTFFAIKTAAASEQLVLTLRDLFQVVYEQKKKQLDEAKEKLDKDKEGETPSGDGNASGDQPASGDSSPSGTGQTPKAAPVDDDNVYHVPPNNAPVNGTIEEQQANLLDLEDQADSILKGIEQIKNLEFDSLPSDDKPSSTPVSPQAFGKGTADPWAPAAASNVGDLAGIQTGPFVNMQQPFPGQGFNTPAFNMNAAGLPVSQNPFGTDPFTGNFQQPGMRPVGYVTSPVAGNPFGGSPFGQPFQPGMVRQPMPGGMFPAPQMNINVNPYAANPKPAEDPNLLKPMRPDQGQEAQDPSDTRSKSPRSDPFADLVGIKKSTNNASNPKDMFAQLTASDKKSMNELKHKADGPPQAFGNQ